VREPVDRVVSRWYFRNRPGKRPPPYSPETEVLGMPLEEIYAFAGAPADASPHHRAATHFFNYQARSLLAPFCDTFELPLTPGPPEDADLWRQRLFAVVDEHYTVGVTEQMGRSLRLFSELFGWEFAREPHDKRNPHRPPVAELAPDLRETIAACNWLDAELHRRASERLAALGSAEEPEAAAVGHVHQADVG
jgi:hypothetical protein